MRKAAENAEHVRYRTLDKHSRGSKPFDTIHYGSVSAILQRIDYGALAGTGRGTLSHVNHILVLPRVFRVNIAELAVQINIGRRRALDLPAK